MTSSEWDGTGVTVFADPRDRVRKPVELLCREDVAFDSFSPLLTEAMERFPRDARGDFHQITLFAISDGESARFTLATSALRQVAEVGLGLSVDISLSPAAEADGDGVVRFALTAAEAILFDSGELDRRSAHALLDGLVEQLGAHDRAGGEPILTLRLRYYTPRGHFGLDLDPAAVSALASRGIRVEIAADNRARPGDLE